MEKYEYLLVKSKEIWEESIAGGGYKKKEVQGDAAPARPSVYNKDPAYANQVPGSTGNKPSSS
jgi:hypothetical protein